MSQGYTKGIPIDTDGTLSANSDLLVSSQKAVKTYVDNEIAELTTNVQNKIADYTLIISDAQDEIVATTAGTIKITVPLDSSVAFPIGTKIGFTADSTGLVYFEATGGVTIISIDSFLGIIPSGGHAILIKIDTDTWELWGDLKIALDADAEAYIVAMEGAGASFTDVQKGYINTFVLSMKAGGVWAKKNAVYPFLGALAGTHKFNAKNPLDTDAAFRMVFTGSPTHDVNGVTVNGTTQYGDTKFAPATYLNINSKNISVYYRSVGVASNLGAMSAGYQGEYLFLRSAGTTYWNLSTSSDSLATPSTYTGFYALDRSASNAEQIRRNDVQIDVAATASVYNPTQNLYIGCLNLNGAAVSFSADNFCYFSIGESLSTSELTAEYNAVAALQLAFGRNV